MTAQASGECPGLEPVLVLAFPQSPGNSTICGLYAGQTGREDSVWTDSKPPCADRPGDESSIDIILETKRQPAGCLDYSLRAGKMLTCVWFVRKRWLQSPRTTPLREKIDGMVQIVRLCGF